MNTYATRAYQRVNVDTGVGAADPHALVQMLFDGALEAIKQAEGHLAAGRVQDKGRALAKAGRIVEEGLKASLDRRVGGALAQQLAALYDYINMRLLQANLRGDAAALAEAARLLGDLRVAWNGIGRNAASTQVSATPGATRASPYAAPVASRLAISA